MDQPTKLNPGAVNATQLLESYLVERDCACPGCGYNLRNLRSARCPECALDIELTIRLTEPRQGAVIAGLVGLAAGAGFSALLLIYLCYIVFFKHFSSDLFLLLVQLSAATIIEGFALWLWIRYWPKLRRQSAATRRLLVALCWFLTAVNLIVFIAGVR